VRGTEGNLSAAGLAGKRKAAEVPTCPVVSSPRVSLIRQTVAVVPDVCGLSSHNIALSRTKVRSRACETALPFASSWLSSQMNSMMWSTTNKAA
jgi:hypothetical protein